MGDQYYVDEYDEEPDMDELNGYMSPDEGDGDLAGFERPEMNVDFSTAVVVSNLPKVCASTCAIVSATAANVCLKLRSLILHCIRQKLATIMVRSAHVCPTFLPLPRFHFSNNGVLPTRVPQNSSPMDLSAKLSRVKRRMSREHQSGTKGASAGVRSVSLVIPDHVLEVSVLKISSC